MDEAKRNAVREQAGNRCEVCGLHQIDSPPAVLHIEQIRPRKPGGADDLHNLVLACVDCNLHKGSNLAGYDPRTSALTQPFDPRRHIWSDPFEWHGVRIVGVAAIGRTTVEVLPLHAEERLQLRIAARQSPGGDPQSILCFTAGPESADGRTTVACAL